MLCGKQSPYGLASSFPPPLGGQLAEVPPALPLCWPAGGDPSAHSWWDGGSFHANLAKSTGLVRQERKYVDLANTPERVRRVHRRMLPHYQHLYAHRIVL